MSHNERCKECKVRVRQLLEKIYGSVIPNYRIQLGTYPEDLREHPRYPVLNDIYSALQNHRGYDKFVRAAYVDVDFFLPEQKMIVEFDESQHFTEPRKIAFFHYPSDLNLGFSRDTWMKHCDDIQAYDIDPPFRDEQRAWYDTLRDFIPEMKGFRSTVRLFARDMAWCSLDPEKPEDNEKFRSFLGTSKNMDVQIQTDKDPTIARVIIAGPWSGDVAEARCILETVAEKWGSNTPVEFLLTPGAFIRFTWPEKYLPVGNVTYPNHDAVESLRKAAERDIDVVLPPRLCFELAKHAKYLTIGADSNNEIYQIEFVCVINLVTNERLWTGKSYPNSEQEQQLIRIKNLESHFPELNNRRVLVLGCHDLHIFNNRWDSREELLSPWRIETRSEMNRLSKIYQPNLVLQHPHSTDSCGTWRQGWTGLLEKIASVQNFASDGLYYHDGDPCRNSLQEILQASKQGDSLDFIFHFEKALPEQRKILPSVLPHSSVANPHMERIPVGVHAHSGIYEKLRKELDILFGKSVIDQKTKFTYRAENEIGYPNKKELDMISLHKPGINTPDQVRFRVYPHILASHSGLQNADEVIKVLPEGSVTKQERENPHLGDIFIEGVFSDEEEIKKFVKWIVYGNDRVISGDA